MEQLAYWQLDEYPFESSWDMRFYFYGRDHAVALGQLDELALEDHTRLGVLTGNSGMGKTLTRAAFAERLPEEHFRVVTLENPHLGFCDLVAAILQRLNGEPPRGKRTRYYRRDLLFAAAEKMRASDRRLVLIFDDAQHIPLPTLGELKMLTEIDKTIGSHLTILLVGEPELQRHIGEVPEIDAQVTARFHLNPFDRRSTNEYLKHRLRVAGHPSGELFTAEAVDWAFCVSKGVPRKLNGLARLALDHARLKGHPNVPLSSVNAVVHNLVQESILGETRNDQKPALASGRSIACGVTARNGKAVPERDIRKREVPQQFTGAGKPTGLPSGFEPSDRSRL